MNFDSWITRVTDWLTTSGLRLLLIVILTMVALRLARLVSDRLHKIFTRDRFEGETQKRAKTLGSLVRYALSATIMIVALVTVLGEFGIEIGPILAAAGVVGLAIGFGAQQLVQDVISGFFILLEDQIRVGDVVQVAGKAGLVEKVNLRMVVLRDLAGCVHYVRNGQIDLVTNMTQDFSYAVFDIGVAYRENIDEVIEVIKQVGDELRNDETVAGDIMEPIEVFGLDKFGDSALIVKARIKTRPIKQWNVGRAFNRLLKQRFDEKNIEIPFPHLTLYMGRDKQGAAPPLYVDLNQRKATQD